MAIQTTPISLLTITPAEVARVDAQVAALIARVAELEAQLGPQRLYVDGRTLRRKGGARVRGGIESMWAAQSAVGTFVDRHKALGAEIVSPLPQGRWLANSLQVATHQTLVSAIEAAGCVVGYNVDHMLQDGVGQNGRDWLCRPEVVAMCNAATNLFLECEVETGWNQTAIQWRDDVTAMVLQLRAAGHKSPIKVGSPDGGRSPRRALEAGAQVLAADPLHQVVFSWQCYWGLQTSGWTYQFDQNGVPPGLAGTLAMCDLIKDSGLCFLVGLEAQDDIGPTGYADVAARLRANGTPWQWWVLSNGGDPTALYDSNGAVRSLGTQVKGLLEQA
jgi:hypothetical protein